ncbi:MAG TPA: CcmD family protein [Anaerolineae bacterium]|nr:CcmD family protein [Anaerolineae bacterium]HOR00622.1 CcmD family protein [Anaerolineae bacterium]HPL28833.1 CcmD family protein [Anaerolineae bacterium]
MNSTYLLVAAYALIWVFVFGYIAWLGRRQAWLQREVELLRKAIEGYSGRKAARG